MQTRRERWRSRFPARGSAYELFDTSVFLFLFAVVGYIVTEPPAGVALSLSAPLHVVTENQLGTVLAVAAAVGIVCSYMPDYLALGYLLTRIAAAFMTINFLVALTILAVNGVALCLGDGFLPAGVDFERVARSAFLYALIFGWVTRRLSRDYGE